MSEIEMDDFHVYTVTDEWTQFGLTQEFGVITWRQKWQAIRDILSGSMKFRITLWMSRLNGAEVLIDDVKVIRS